MVNVRRAQRQAVTPLVLELQAVLLSILLYTDCCLVLLCMTGTLYGAMHASENANFSLMRGEIIPFN